MLPIEKEMATEFNIGDRVIITAAEEHDTCVVGCIGTVTAVKHGYGIPWLVELDDVPAFYARAHAMARPGLYFRESAMELVSPRPMVSLKIPGIGTVSVGSWAGMADYLASEIADRQDEIARQTRCVAELNRALAYVRSERLGSK